MSVKIPYLVRFKKECVSPKRNSFDGMEYDEKLDMLMIRENGSLIPAIDSDHFLNTKKADIEKGEDQKDTLMWTN